MKILVIHHLEPCWEGSYCRYGTNFVNLERQVARWIKRNQPDHVILTRLEEWSIDDKWYPHLYELVDKVEPYGYGWDEELANQLREQNETVIEGGTHSQYVWVPSWIKELKGNKIRVCGAFRNECLDDLETALISESISFRYIQKLVVG